MARLRTLDFSQLRIVIILNWSVDQCHVAVVRHVHTRIEDQLLRRLVPVALSTTLSPIGSEVLDNEAKWVGHVVSLHSDAISTQGVVSLCINRHSEVFDLFGSHQ